MRKTTILALAITLVVGLITIPASAQVRSPKGQAATQTGPGYGNWLEITYSRPILRGRQGIFGEGESYGQKVNAGAPVWRAGADTSTRFQTSVALKFGDTTLEAGEYSLFVNLSSATSWELIISSHKAQAQYDPNDKEAIWGAYGYDASKDVARVAMDVGPPTGFSMDQLTWFFTDVTETGGNLSLIWDQTIGQVPFTVVE